MTLLHEEITSPIIDAAFKVHKTLGYGFLEKVYQKAMQVGENIQEIYSANNFYVLWHSH